MSEIKLGLTFRRIRGLVRSSLRYKLLMLVLFPTLLAMPATYGFTLYWFNNFTRDNLLLKVKSDLALAHDALTQIGRDYAAPLQRLASSYGFRLLLSQSDAQGLQNELQTLIDDKGFTFVHITDELGNWLFEQREGARQNSKPTPLTDLAAHGRPSTALEVFSPDDLLREHSELVGQARVTVIDTSSEAAEEQTFETRAIVLRAVHPIKDAQGQVLAFLDGGVLLSGNNGLIEDLRHRVYGAGTLPEGALGAMAILLGNVRVSTNFPDNEGRTTLGTRVSETIRQHVLDAGKVWASRDRVGGQWYIAAYMPLFDVHGQGMGMLQTGFLEAPFRYSYYRAAALLLAIFIILIALSTWIVFRGARSIFRPIEQMTAVVRATQAGLEKRIGKVDSQDEIGELARQFDTMLSLLQQRNREIQRAAGQLEAKVEERTHELADKNVDLERTVNLLRETRQQLIMAEKLAALGQMAAGIAHEINNPTAVILGHLDLLASELGDAAGNVQGDIEMIMQQVARIRYIVDSLLQFAKPSPQSDEVDLQNIDVNSAIKDTFPLVRHAIERGSIEVRRHLRATRTVRIQRYELQEVLINLLLNAARAASDQGAGAIEVMTEDWDENGVVISVRDNGIGIAPDQLGRVFDPFFTTDVHNGTGLGLSVSYGLIRRYGGEITVQSELGQGSIFQVWLLAEPVLAAQGSIMEYSGVQ
ncbi:MAG: ATP-binding protein [Acidiferrobacterales bacterium]